MLTEIQLISFKCFEDDVFIPISHINLFTGINGRGKSTVLQALLLMRQSIEHSSTTNQIILNGSCVELGTFNDIRNSNTSRNDQIVLGFQYHENDNHIWLSYGLGENYDDDMVANIDNLSKIGDIYGKIFKFDDTRMIIAKRWHNLNYEFPGEKDNPAITSFIKKNVNFTKIHYISADRIGPQDYYPKQTFGDFPNVGRRGEYTANILAKMKDAVVHELLCLEKGETHTVLDQTEAWLSHIFDGGKIDIRTPEANIVIMQLNSEKSRKLYKPANVGFGYSYALPIIVSGLIAKPGEKLIVENPEAHLHPYAQSKITQFLAKVSASGVQVFIESHSDHILNGLRVAVLDKVITPRELNILYFKRDGIIQIPIAENGAIEDWPSGFFDQTDKDFERLFGV